jgi:hypothetical protein
MRRREFITLRDGCWTMARLPDGWLSDMVNLTRAKDAL